MGDVDFNVIVCFQMHCWMYIFAYHAHHSIDLIKSHSTSIINQGSGLQDVDFHLVCCRFSSPAVICESAVASNQSRNPRIVCNHKD